MKESWCEKPSSSSALLYRPLKILHVAVGSYWLAQQQPVLRRDVCRNRLRPDLVALRFQPHRAHHVDRERAVDPAVQVAGVVTPEIVTTRQHSDARSSVGGPVEDQIGQRAAGVARDD